jgi:hypothetical protein
MNWTQIRCCCLELDKATPVSYTLVALDRLCRVNDDISIQQLHGITRSHHAYIDPEGDIASPLRLAPTHRTPTTPDPLSLPLLHPLLLLLLV